MMDGHALNAAASCESLSSLALPNTSITLAQMVPAGGFSLPGTGPAAVQQFSQLPAFCRVAATLTPSSDSDIKIEVWLPAAAWNGKFQAVGNGGWAGTISYGALASALQEVTRRHRRTRDTSVGLRRSRSDIRKKVVDFAYRAVHEMAVTIEGRYRGLLRSRATVLVLDGLLHGRAAGADGGSALSGRLRWDYRRRSCEQSDAVVRLADRRWKRGSFRSGRVLFLAPNSPSSIGLYSPRVTRSTE